MSIAHNKLSITYIHQYAFDNNIKFVDDEYRSNTYRHNWICGKCGMAVIQALDKIKRAGGNLSCCSRALPSIKKAMIIAERCNVVFHASSFTNACTPSKWTCPLHGDFYYPLTFANRLKNRASVCEACRSVMNSNNAQDKLNNIKTLVPFIEYVDARPFTSLGVSYKWKCTIHEYETTSRGNLIMRNKRLKCCRHEENRGPNHYAWNDELTEIQRTKKRNYSANQVWSNAVRTRDGWKCVLCHYGRKCVAHHLYSYMAYPALRYEVSNGVTLCRQHHIDFHKMYGNTTNPDNFESYRSSYNESSNIQP